MSLQKQILEELSDNPKIQILDVFRGSSAVKKAEILLFKADYLAASEWSKQWTANEKRKALLVIYQWTARTRKNFGFKLVIGDSVSGEKYRTTTKNKQFFELYHYI